MSLKKIDRYFVLELIKILFVSVLVAQIVLLSLQAIRLSELVINQGLEWGLISRMLFGLALSFMPVVLPIAFLFSLLVVFGRMSSDSEFLALQAMGRSPKRLLLPGLFVGTLVCLLSLWVSFYLGPLGNRNFEISIDTVFKKQVTRVLRSGTFTEGFLNMVLFVDEVDPATQELKKVFLFDEKSFSENTAISASRGKWVQDSKSGLGVLKLIDGQILSQNHEGDRVQRIRFDEYNVYTDFSTEMSGSRNSPASQDWGQLLEQRKSLQNNVTADPRKIWMEIARRFAISIACVLFLPLCFAMSLDHKRTAKNRAVFNGLLIVLLYWTAYFGIATNFQRFKVQLFREYEIFSWGAIFIPNIILAIVGLWLFYKKSTIVGKR